MVNLLQETILGTRSVLEDREWIVLRLPHSS
jgi:hypothetical protein